MTELNDGPAAEQGTPADSNPSAENGSNGGSGDPFAGLSDEGTREWVTKLGVKDIDSLANMAFEREKRLQKSVQLPADDAPAEEWDKFYSKVNERLAPKDTEGYAFQLPEGIPENMPYDENFAKEFKAFAHENKLPTKVAAQLHDWFVSKSGSAFAAGLESREQQAGNATKALNEAWGEPDSQGFKEAQEYFFKFVDGNGGDDLLQELQQAGVIDEHKQVFLPKTVIALAKAGRAQFGEDSLVTDGRTSGKNPFAKETSDWGERQRLIKEDPSLAKRLIEQAGLDPAPYGLG